MVWSFKKTDALTEQQFSLWENLLEKRTGIQLAQAQHVLLQTQVSIRMRELGIADYQQYFDLVKSESTGLAEWQVLVDRLVVKETSFFRHRPSLEIVKKALEEKLAVHSGKQEAAVPLVLNDSFEIWSVGCSTGEEPYAIAAIANEYCEDLGVAPYFGVTAVDISLPALSIARKGVYSRRSLNLLEQDELEKYFVSSGKDQYRVVDKIKKRVCFSQANILQLESKPVQPMDIIFCQNVLIYFRRWRRREILKQLVKHLKPGGILVIGLGEITEWSHDDLRRMESSDVQAYRKVR